MAASYAIAAYMQTPALKKSMNDEDIGWSCQTDNESTDQAAEERWHCNQDIVKRSGMYQRPKYFMAQVKANCIFPKTTKVYLTHKCGIELTT